MSQKKTIKTYEYAISMTIQRGKIPDTGVYETLNSTYSIMYDTSAHILEYRSYWFLMPTVVTLKYIFGWIIIVSVGNEERKNGSCNMVDFIILSLFENIES